MVCGYVWSRILVNVEALAHWGLSRQKQTNKQVPCTKTSLHKRDTKLSRRKLADDKDIQLILTFEGRITLQTYELIGQRFHVHN